MFVEASEIPQRAVIETDVCIVGAGPAGIALAYALRGTPVQVCLLESGGLSEEPDIQALNIGENIGIDDVPLDEARYRMFGGTTHRWAGWCRPLDDIDFEPRPWVEHSGWPIGRADLEPYYQRAQELCQIPEYRYEAADWEMAIHPLYRPPFASGAVHSVVFQGSPPTKFGHVYKQAIEGAGNLNVYLHATAVEIDVNEAGQEATRVRVATLGGGGFHVAARVLVLTAGGIETPRLLLASRKVHANGLGNQNDNVGRYFMEHPHVLSGYLRVTDPGDSGRRRIPAIDAGLAGLRDRLVFQRPVAGIKCAYTIAPEVQQELGLLNYSAHLSTVSENAVDLPSYRSLKLIVGNMRSPRRLLWQLRNGALPQGLREHLANVVGDFDNIWRVLYQELLRRPRRLAIHTQAEQAPDPQSRITLGYERDPLGVPRVRVDWRLSLADKQSVRHAQEVVGLQLERAGIGRLEPEPWLLRDDTEWGPRLSGGFHHLGTARMADDPRCGVVDRNCRVHGLANLYVADSSVFPTGGYANPTLTAVAVALRAADHIKREVLAASGARSISVAGSPKSDVPAAGPAHERDGNPHPQVIEPSSGGSR